MTQENSKEKKDSTLVIRVPQSLRDKIHKVAMEEDRSISQLLCKKLSQMFQ